MAVRLNVNARVTGAGQVTALNRSVQGLGRASNRSAVQLGTLEAAAARGRASFASLATTLNVGLVAGFAAVGFGIQRFIRDTFEAGNLIEGLEIRFRLLFGSVEEGGRAFDQLSRFAARVPFSLEDIAAASGNLAVVSEDANELGNILEITGNVAAATGLSFRQTAEQIQRSFAGGIASADVFRERGVRAMLGFQAGVTVSVEETVQRFNEVFGPGGTFGNATELLADTLQGQVSLVQDAYFQFRTVVSEQFFDFLTSRIRALVGDFQNNSERLTQLATQAGQAIQSALEGIESGARFVVRNWEAITNVFQGFIALRIATFIQGITAAVISLNVAAAANPIGLIVTAVAAGIATVITFREELGQIADALDRIISRGGGQGAEADAAEARAGVEADIANSVRLAAEHKARIQAIETGGHTQAIARLEADIADNAEKALAAKELQDRIDERINTRAIAYTQNVRIAAAETVTATENTIEQNRQLLIASERVRAVADFNRMISEEKQTQIDRQERLNTFLNDQANLSRRAFQDTVRQAEAAQRLIDFESAANNRERGSLVGRDPQASQEAIDAILQQEMAWESVLEVVDDIGRTVADNLFDSIQRGESVFDSLRQSGVDAINEIARNLLRSGISQLLTGGVQSAAGGGTGSFLNTIFGGARRVLGFNQGGIVPGEGIRDTVPALLTPGERVIPRDEVRNGMSSNITNINISGNVDQRSIDQIRGVIANSPAQVGQANIQNMGNTRGLRGRNR